MSESETSLQTTSQPETVVLEAPVKATKFCSECGAEISAKAEICPKCGVRIAPAPITAPPRTPKDKTTAAVLAIFLGGLGIHKFYMGGGSTKWGVIYLVFCWTFIPAILSFIEGVILLTMSDADFHASHG